MKIISKEFKRKGFDYIFERDGKSYGTPDEKVFCDEDKAIKHCIENNLEHTIYVFRESEYGYSVNEKRF